MASGGLFHMEFVTQAFVKWGTNNEMRQYSELLLYIKETMTTSVV
jgi:hypothetical protein